MAAKIFKVFSAVFTPTGGSAYTIPGVTSAQETISAQKRTTRADGAIAVNKIYMEGHECSVQLTSESNEMAVVAAGRSALPYAGAKGVLVLVCKEQLTGVGLDTPTHTRTYPASGAAALSAVVLTAGPSPSMPVDGNPSTSLTFEVAESAGNPAMFVSVADA